MFTPVGCMWSGGGGTQQFRPDLRVVAPVLDPALSLVQPSYNTVYSQIPIGPADMINIRMLGEKKGSMECLVYIRSLVEYF